MVDYHDIFTQDRRNIGMNTELQVKLNPKDNKFVYSQNLPVAIRLKEDLKVELALMHKYGTVTVWHFFKHASPVFAQRKPNGKLRLLVDLRKMNILIADDYTKFNHPLSTLSDAVQHLAGKSLFWISSQAYQCLQMADRRWAEMLAFNLLAEHLPTKDLHKVSADVAAFSSFMPGYLDPVVKADRCAPYMDVIGIAANSATDLIRNIRAVVQSIHQARLKLTREKCHFGLGQFEVFGRTISPEGISPQARKCQTFSTNSDSQNRKQRYLGFVNYYRILIPRKADNLGPSCKLLKAEVPINITSDSKETIDSVNITLSDACELASKQPIAGKQLSLMTDSSFRTAGNAPMIEKKPWPEKSFKAKNVRPCGVWTENLVPSATQNIYLLRKILVIYMALPEYAHVFWKATKPTNFLTDNKSVTRLF